PPTSRSLARSPEQHGDMANTSPPARLGDHQTLANGQLSVGPGQSLENLMTMVAELVLTQNQLLEMLGRQNQSEFRAKLQQLTKISAGPEEGAAGAGTAEIGDAW